MEDRRDEPQPGEEPTAAEAGGFLPPEPPGPEPELGGAAPKQPPPGQPPPPAAPNAGFPAGLPGGAGGGQQPAPPGQPLWSQPPPGQPAPPAGQPDQPQSQPQPGQPAAQPPPAQQPGWTQPPGGWQQQPAQAQWSAPNAGFPTGTQWPPPPPGQPPVYMAPAPPVPGNSQAVAGFVLSVVSAGLLVLSLGFSSIISLIASALGIFFSLRGRKNVDEGRTPKHRDLAQVGFITGIVGVVLAILAIVGWTLIIVLAGDSGSDENLFEPAVRLLG